MLLIASGRLQLLCNRGVESGLLFSPRAAAERGAFASRLGTFSGTPSSHTGARISSSLLFTYSRALVGRFTAALVTGLSDLVGRFTAALVTGLQFVLVNGLGIILVRRFRCICGLVVAIGLLLHLLALTFDFGFDLLADLCLEGLEVLIRRLVTAAR